MQRHSRAVLDLKVITKVLLADIPNNQALCLIERSHVRNCGIFNCIPMLLVGKPETWLRLGRRGGGGWLWLRQPGRGVACMNLNVEYTVHPTPCEVVVDLGVGWCPIPTAANKYGPLLGSVPPRDVPALRVLDAHADFCVLVLLKLSNRYAIYLQHGSAILTPGVHVLQRRHASFRSHVL